MLTALLLSPGFKYKEVSINDYRDIRNLIGGFFEMLPTKYNEIKVGKYSMVAYVNENGYTENRLYNEWGSVLDDIGFYVNHLYGIRGNIVILLTNERGEDKSINEDVVKIFHSQVKC